MTAVTFWFFGGLCRPVEAQSAFDLNLPDPARLAVESGDWLTADGLFRARALQGDPIAMVNLGRMHWLGLGRAPSPGIACDWFERAASKGLSRAYLDLGGCFAIGRGRAASGLEAMAWYRRAIAAGQVAGLCALGGLYLQGRADVPTDPERGAQLCLEGARKGDDAAKVLGAQVLTAGIGVPANAAMALDLLEQAATAGRADAQFLLGRARLNGLGGLLPVDDLAAEWFARSARQGYGPAQLALGTYFADNRAVEENNQRRVKAYEARRAYFWLGLVQRLQPGSAAAARAEVIQAEVEADVSPAQRQNILEEISRWQPLGSIDDLGLELPEG
ncbi:MAG: tetratricopeptide repeat protein [Magnetovibrionaceae bacterium]